jgi:hypothetical protein
MTIQLSQIVLILALALFTVYVFRVRSVMTDRILYLFFAVVGITLVIDPDLSSRLAHLLGIGRGVDLITYLFIIAGLFFSVAITSGQKRQQRLITQVVRHLALAAPLYGRGLTGETGSLPTAKESRDEADKESPLSPQD